MVLVLTLPSDSSFEYFPHNTVARFRVQLPQEYNFDGDYEVGLTQLQYPHTWYNTPAEGMLIQAAYMTPGGEWAYAREPVKVKGGYYSSTQALVLAVNKALQRIDFDIEPKQSAYCVLEYDTVSQKVRYKTLLKVKQDIRIKLPPDLQFKLGFSTDAENSRWLVNKDRGAITCDLRGGFHNIYAFTDIAKSVRVVGHTLQPLLRSVPVQGNHGDMVLFEPKTVDWLPLRFRQLRQVEIYLTTDMGQLVQFERGKSVVTLHIRRARPLDS